ncbi:MAG: prephenate dehydratase [Gammaproteobacteria bacterium]
MSEKLDDIRTQIDAIDRQVQALVTERAQLALKVAGAKRQAGETTNFFRPEREAEVLDMAKARNLGPLPDEAVIRLFREIMSACLALQEPLKVAFLGPEGTFSQDAVEGHFGHGVVPVAQASIEEVFREVESGNAHFGVVPVENSTEGSVNVTLDTFVRSPLVICGEVHLRIRQNLLCQHDDLKRVSRVYSHQQSLAQCREWLDASVPQADRLPVASNAEAARKAAADPDAAAIASESAAEIYGLCIAAAGIEDEPDNITRFAVIGRTTVGPTGNDKTSLMLSVDNKAGALFDVLSPLAVHGVSMTRIESRPSRQANWDYVFFIDIHGHPEDENVSAAIEEMRGKAPLFRILGAFPKARV